MLGHKFSIIGLYESGIAIHEEVVYKAGVLDKLASVRALNIAVLDLVVNRKSTLEKIIRVSQKAIEDDGADCLVLGCGMMGFLNVADEISKFLKIPVINPPKIALKMAESLVSIGLMHSKKAFALPPKLSSGKVKNIDQLFVYGHSPKGCRK
jgi:allantoin racemase